MIISGFINGELIYILEFPFICLCFVKRLKKQLDKRFPNGDKMGEFLRSANFIFEHYKNCKKLKIVYLNKNKLSKNKNNFTKNFYNFLMNL